MPAYSGPVPFRPMRRARREVTDLAELRDIVSRAQVLRIASADAEGPFITPLSFGFEVVERLGAPSWTFWAHCAPEGRKTDAWAAAPEVALELDIPGGVIAGDFACSYSYAYESVMAVARASRVTDPAERRRGLSLVMGHMAPGAPVELSDEALERTDIWRFDVERLTGKRREGEPLGEGPERDDGHGKRDKHGKQGKHGKHGKHHGCDRGDGHGRGEAPAGHGKHRKRDKGDGRGTPDAPKLSKKDLKREVERVLGGERCPGCGRHCKLTDPHCGKGRKVRERRLEKAGLR